MDGYVKLKAEINGIRNFALLNMFELDCMYLNKEMSDRCVNLRTSLIRWQVDTNKTWNRQICNQFDEMATKLGEIPDKTKELVELQRYIPYDSLISYHIQIGMGSIHCLNKLF